MKNWLERSIPWKVSSLVLERITLYLMIGFSVMLGGTRVLGRWEAFLMLFFIPVIAGVTYYLEVGSSRLRARANKAIFVIMALLVVKGGTSLANMNAGASWNPFVLLLVMQLFMGVMVFERRYLSLILESTAFSILILLLTMEKTAEFYWMSFTFAMVLLSCWGFSFSTAQWSCTVPRGKGLWHVAAPLVSYRRVLSIAGQGIVILLIGLGLGFLMSRADWKISVPEEWMRILKENIRIDPRAFESHLTEEEKELKELETMSRLLKKKPEATEEFSVNQQEEQKGQETKDQRQKTEDQKIKPAEQLRMIHPVESLPLGQELQMEQIPRQPTWQRFLFLLAVILLFCLAGVLLGSWLFFWIRRLRIRGQWLRVRRENPTEFLKVWMHYLRNLLEKYGIGADLFLSPAEYLEGVVGILKIQFRDREQIKQVLLKGWYSSMGIREEDLSTVADVYREILATLKKKGSWRQRLQLFCLRIQW